MSLGSHPPQLIINWDQTAVHYVPVGSWTMELEGAKRVDIAGKVDKTTNNCSIWWVYGWRFFTYSASGIQKMLSSSC